MVKYSVYNIPVANSLMRLYFKVIMVALLTE